MADNVREGRVAVARLLLKHKADPTIRNTYSDETPLDKANRYDGHKAMIDLLNAAMEARNHE